MAERIYTEQCDETQSDSGDSFYLSTYCEPQSLWKMKTGGCSGTDMLKSADTGKQIMSLTRRSHHFTLDPVLGTNFHMLSA